ncbi:MxaL protein [Paraburkholderia phenoliruptrix]|nr:MxaL protein [Paraburkholderia phenoliruptrix]MBW9103151.1 MxaL protein [Paraburkholderia phenoliruptrix]MBW9127957.1 MxaL protein [Paraburkholderia ginsengiterrae]
MRGMFAGRHWTTAAALVLLLLALVLPPVPLPRNVSSYVVTFDITQSMNVEDTVRNGAPVSRLAFARAAMRDALGQLPCGSKIGWSAFTGQRSFLLLPPVEVCANYDALLASLDRIDGQMRWTNYSRIAEGGVYSAVRVAQALGSSTAVAFVTDGQEAPPLLPSDALKQDINPARVKGWLIGVGGDQPAPIPRSDAHGNRIGYWQADEVVQVPQMHASATHAASHEELSALQGHYLATVAAQVGFNYRRMIDAESLRDALLDERLSRRETVPTDLRWCPAVLALLLLVWRFMPESAVSSVRRHWRFRLRLRSRAEPVGQSDSLARGASTARLRHAGRDGRAVQQSGEYVE